MSHAGLLLQVCVPQFLQEFKTHNLGEWLFSISFMEQNKKCYKYSLQLFNMLEGPGLEVDTSWFRL